MILIDNYNCSEIINTSKVINMKIFFNRYFDSLLCYTVFYFFNEKLIHYLASVTCIYLIWYNIIWSIWYSYSIYINWSAKMIKATYIDFLLPSSYYTDLFYIFPHVVKTSNKCNINGYRHHNWRQQYFYIPIRMF